MAVFRILQQSVLRSSSEFKFRTFSSVGLHGYSEMRYSLRSPVWRSLKQSASGQYVRPFSCHALKNASVSSRPALRQMSREFQAACPTSVICQRPFHTSQPHKALPPLLWVMVRPVMNVVALLFGRTIKRWWKRIPQERKAKVLNRLKKFKYHILGLLGVCAFSTLMFYVSHLEVDPLTNRQRFMMFSHKDMQNICQPVVTALIGAAESQILPGNHPLYRRVERVMHRIMQANHDDILRSGVRRWAIYVINDPNTKNAMVLPNGTVFIYSGIMDACSNDDQLGTVLAHEVSHTVLNHQGEILSREQFFGALLMLVVVTVWAVLPDAAAFLSQLFATKATDVFVHLPFSRQMETEADSVGLRFAAKACLDVREASAFWGKMAILADLGGEQAPEEFLSTHPANETRQKIIDELIPEAIKLRECSQCPKLSLADPRQLVEIWRKQLESKKAPAGISISI